MKVELNDQEIELLRDALEAAVGDLNEAIDRAGHPDRQVLRERRVRLRWLREALLTRSA